MLGDGSKKILKVLIIGASIILALVILGFVSVKVASQEKKTGYNIEYSVNKENNKTVFDALKSYSEKNKIELKYNNNYSFGVFIESIGSVKNGDDGKYWQYYVNGKLGEVAADKKEVRQGDRVEWRFEKVPEF